MIRPLRVTRILAIERVLVLQVRAMYCLRTTNVISKVCRLRYMRIALLLRGLRKLGTMSIIFTVLINLRDCRFSTSNVIRAFLIRCSASNMILATLGTNVRRDLALINEGSFGLVPLLNCDLFPYYGFLDLNVVIN